MPSASRFVTKAVLQTIIRLRRIFFLEAGEAGQTAIQAFLDQTCRRIKRRHALRRDASGTAAMGAGGSRADVLKAEAQRLRERFTFIGLLRRQPKRDFTSH